MFFCFNAGEIFQVAVEIEKNGLAFYESARQAVSDPEVRELFAALARDEVEHKHRFEALLSELPEELKRPTVSDLDNELDLYIRNLADQHVFGTGEGLKSQSACALTTEDALKLALQFEKDSVIFYLGMQEATCEGKARDVIDLLIKEEQQHLRRLSLQIGKCSANVKECLLHWPK
jgi:rubrerythrin